MDTTIVIKAVPKPQQRHRHTRKGWTYDPSKKDKAEFLLMALKHKPTKPYKNVHLILTFSFQRPKSHYRSGKLKATSPKNHTTKPDIDNLVKFVMDALNRNFWSDDSQIFSIEAKKVYGENYTEIKIREEYE